MFRGAESCSGSQRGIHTQGGGAWYAQLGRFSFTSAGGTVLPKLTQQVSGRKYQSVVSGAQELLGYQDSKPFAYWLCGLGKLFNLSNPQFPYL